MNELTDIDQIIGIMAGNYSGLTEPCRTAFKDFAKIVEVDKLTVLVKEGQYADKAYFMIKGCARAFYLKDGKDISDWFAFENDFICSINSFFLDVPSPHFIEVMEPAVLLEVSKEHTHRLSETYPDFDRLIKSVVIKTMLQLQQRVVAIQFETAQQKYENLVKIRPDIVQRIPLTHIASYLGITLETLSRIRHPKKRI